MKKIKFLGAALLAASLIFSGCANGSDDDVSPEPTKPAVEKPTDTTGTDTTDGTEDGADEGTNNGSETNNGGDTTSGGDTTNGGDTTSGGESSGSGDSEDAGDGDSGDEDEDTNEYTAPDLTDYFKYELVSSPKNAATNKAVANWSSGSGATPNDDGTWTISSSASMWNGVGGICAAFTGFEAGTLANYDYIVFTVDTTDYEIDTADDGPGNKGVNIKVPEIQKDISSNYVANGNVRTYYAPMSLFETAPQGATEFAIIIGGSGTLKVNEVYFATTEDPASREITGITITPATSSLEQNGTLQFTVKDSNFVVCTEDVTYSLSGEAAPGSEISETGLLTVGTTAGSLTVTASYSVGEEIFTSSATITVIGTMTNLITDISFLKAYLNPDWGQTPILADVTDYDAVTNYINIADDNSITYALPSGLNAQWQAQLKIGTDADLSEGDEWYFTCKFDGVTGGYTIKLNDDVKLTNGEVTGNIGENGKTITLSGTVPAGENYTNLPIVFDFGTCSEGTLTISDIVLSKTN